MSSNRFNDQKMCCTQTRVYVYTLNKQLHSRVISGYVGFDDSDKDSQSPHFTFKYIVWYRILCNGCDTSKLSPLLSIIDSHWLSIWLLKLDQNSFYNLIEGVIDCWVVGWYGDVCEYSTCCELEQGNCCDEVFPAITWISSWCKYTVRDGGAWAAVNEAVATNKVEIQVF
jgi:hypothetical protein